jgi:broad specificity phosphatase PhoE
VALLGLFATAAPVGAQQAVFVVRHAEKVDNSDDSSLSAVGFERAERLAGFLADAGIDAIYGSERQRTIQTAQALANRLGLEIGAIPRAGTDDLVARLRTVHADEVVLIVGHSDTVPDILAALGHAGDITIGGADYDNVFLLIPRAGSAPTLLRLLVD